MIVFSRTTAGDCATAVPRQRPVMSASTLAREKQTDSTITAA